MWCFWVKTFYEVFLFIFTVAVDFAMYRFPFGRRAILPSGGGRLSLRAECDTPSERREAFPSGGGRYSLRAMANRLRFLHRFIGLGSPSSFALQNSLVWSLFFRTVYGFFIGLSVLVRLRVLRCKARWLSLFFANLLWVFHRFVDFGSLSYLQEEIGRIR